MKISSSCFMALVITISSLAYAGPPQLDLNDVTWLWPVPEGMEDLDRVHNIASLVSDDGSLVWSDQQFADLLNAADSDAAKVADHRIDLPEAVRTKDAWRIVAFRVDPTAPGGHEIIRRNFDEKPQIRLVLQPVTVVDGQPQVHDIAIHLVYDFLLEQEGTATRAPDREHFQRIIEDLDDLKNFVEDAGVTTSGEALGVHPGLQRAVPGLFAKVREFLAKHLHAKRLSAMAVMGLDGPEPWIFLALGKIPPEEDAFGPIPFLPAAMISFRNENVVVAPQPRVNNLNPVPSKVMMPAEAKDRLGVATAVLLTDRTLELEDFAMIGTDENGASVKHDQIRNRDIPDVIADPFRSHFFNTDCISCHTETRLRVKFSLAPGDFAFLHDGQPPSIDPSVLPGHDWNVRNLGWFPPSEFIGGGPAVPTITQRTANETAEVVEFIERQYRKQASPEHEDQGAATEASESSNELQSATTSQHAVKYLDQAWPQQDREVFYYLGQGSQLIPYSWFVCLELAKSEELLRSERSMHSWGFIGQPRSGRNPDGLPIGFVKDSNPSSIMMKAGFLGAEFPKDRFPPTDDWLGLTCAACHTSELTYKETTVRIDGGAALADVESFLAALAKSLEATLVDDRKFNRFEERIRQQAGGDIDTSSLREELAAYAPVVAELVERNDAEHAYGLGRLDAFGAILNQICEAALRIPENRRPSNAPVSYPYLWDAPDLDWVQWNSSVDIPIARNVGEVLGVFAHVRLDDTPAELQFDSSVRLDYLHQLEVLLRQLRAPEWPEQILGEIDREKAAAGKSLFAANCAGCHNMRNENGSFERTPPNEFGKTFIKTTSVPFQEIGTDPQMAINFITRTANPGPLKKTVQSDLANPAMKLRLETLRKTIVAMGFAEPDFSEEVPATMLLSAAVHGVVQKHSDKELRNLTEEERAELLLDMRGHRCSNRPPNNGLGYKARPLNGVWATAPFGHSGAVPNLYQWLLPEDRRVKSFYIGSRQFDPKHVGFSTNKTEGAFHFRTVDEDGTPIPGNSNKGHSGPRQTDFTDDERWQIIEYIKTLR